MSLLRRTLLALLCVAGSPALAQSLPAFPGAEGFGADTPGGRGGRVIEVTHLNDDGPGSFRAAAEASGPRIVVFRVGGTLMLDSRIEIREPYITIAGQTAPGGGITLRNGPENSKSALRIATHDVVLRYLRSRPGSNPADGGTLDALSIHHSEAEVYNVVVDHVSLGWSTDEVLQVWYDAHDIAVQWSILSEPLECATHPEGCHSMGMLLGSAGSGEISIHHNLFAHNRHRNPRIKTTRTVDVVNNVIYNSGSGNGWRAPTYVDGVNGVTPANYIANYFKPGPDTGRVEWFIDTDEIVELYAQGNRIPDGVVVVDPDSSEMLVGSRHPAPPVAATSASTAFVQVLQEAGASRGLGCDGTPYDRRDSVDERIVDEVIRGTGSIIDDPSEVGGWPELDGGAPCADSDHDGMPDEFEALYDLDPRDPGDGALDADADGYTNVEEFLNAVRVPEPGPGFLHAGALATLAALVSRRGRRRQTPSLRVIYSPAVGDENPRMPRRDVLLTSLLLALLALVGCATRTELFLNRAHRVNYALETGELQLLQFYISSDVLAHEIGTANEGTPAGVFVVERDTPGRVTEVGPTWLRVSFGPTRGAPFVSVPDEDEDSWYWLATEVEGEPDFRRVRDLDDKVVVVDDRRFRLVYGSNARLRVDSKGLQKLIEKRAHAPGRNR